MAAAAETESVGLHDIDPAELEELVKDAHLPSLLVTLAHATGDYSCLRDEFASATVALPFGTDPTGGMAPEIKEKARAEAQSLILRLRDDNETRQPAPTHHQLRQLMEFITGPVDDAYLPLMAHELALPSDQGAPSWTKSEIAPDRPFLAAVIGAGMSGLAAARRLQQAGIPFIVFERRPDLGGVWLDNSYPGARLDSSNFTYSYSFSQHGTWMDQYSPRKAVLDYLHELSEDFDLTPHIRFNARVVSGEFDPDAGTWSLLVEGPDGVSEHHTVNTIISAVGQLNTPNVPDIAGADTFRGDSWHTAEWNHDVDLRGKRVAVIGTGASAFQLIPKVAQLASRLTVLQRTPAWVIPTPGYNSLLPKGLHWLLENVPNYYRFYRFSQFWRNVDGIRHLAVVDEEWDHPVSISEKNEAVRAALENFLRERFAGRPDLIEKLVPRYPPYAKRTVRDDGTWTSALQQDNVTLTTEKIARITETGIETVDGIVHEADVIVYGTGFAASDFLSTMSLRGRDGTTLKDHWAGDARAYYGTTVPNFPNLFCLYGPNTNLNTNGSVVLFVELALEYTMSCIETLLRSGSASMEVRQEPFDEYNARVDAASKTLAVGHSDVNSWYKNKFGRVSQNWPLPTIDFWSGTRGAVRSDYEFR